MIGARGVGLNQTRLRVEDGGHSTFKQHQVALGRKTSQKRRQQPSTRRIDPSSSLIGIDGALGLHLKRPQQLIGRRTVPIGGVAQAGDHKLTAAEQQQLDRAFSQQGKKRCIHCGGGLLRHWIDGAVLTDAVHHRTWHGDDLISTYGES